MTTEREMEHGYTRSQLPANFVKNPDKSEV